MLEADGSTLFHCPICAVPALCPPNHGTVFNCPNTECGLSTCMKCKKKSHIPLRCEEIVADERNSIAHAVEEEMTLALLRECPNCKTKLIKDQGCNKIICSRCKHAMCYTCGKEISAKKDGYDHFCKIPHCQHDSCNKCVLWDRAGAEGDDAKKVKEAGERATKALRHKLLKEGKSEEEVDEVVKDIRKKHVSNVKTRKGVSSKPVANGAVWNRINNLGKKNNLRKFTEQYGNYWNKKRIEKEKNSRRLPKGQKGYKRTRPLRRTFSPSPKKTRSYASNTSSTTSSNTSSSTSSTTTTTTEAKHSFNTSSGNSNIDTNAHRFSPKRLCHIPIEKDVDNGITIDH